MDFIRIEPEEKGIFKFIRLEDVLKKDSKSKVFKYKYIYLPLKFNGEVSLRKTDTPMRLNIYPYIVGLIHGELTVLEPMNSTPPLYEIDSSYTDTIPAEYISDKVTIKRLNDNLAIIDEYKQLCDVYYKHNKIKV